MSMSNFSEFYKKQNCLACHFKTNGVKTRKSIPHTCGIKEGFVPKNTENRGEEAKRRGYMIEPKCDSLTVLIGGKKFTLECVGSTITKQYIGAHFVYKSDNKTRVFISMAFRISEDQCTPSAVEIDHPDLKLESIDQLSKYLSELSAHYYLREHLKYESYLDVPEEILKKTHNYRDFNFKAYQNLLKKFSV